MLLARLDATGGAMTTLREFIAERKAEIKTQIGALRTEERELKVALDAIDASADADLGGSSGAADRTTIKGRIVEALQLHPGGGSTEQVAAWIESKHGVTIPRSSLSPQISRLKKNGVVILNENKNWQLAEFLLADQESAGGAKCKDKTPPTIFERRPNGETERDPGYTSLDREVGHEIIA